MVGDHEPSVLVLGQAGCAVAVTAAPPPLASAATVPAPPTAPVAPPLHSPAVFVTASATASGNPALPSPGAVVTPPLLSPAATATAHAAALVTPPLLSPAANATAPTAEVMTPPLLSPATAVAPLLLSPTAATKTAPAPPPPPAAAATAATATAAAPTATATAAVPSQTAHAPLSRTGGDAAHVLGNVHGQGRERYMRYTTVFPLCSKGQVVDVFIPWIRAVRLQLRERFRLDLLVLCLHSDRGGAFSSDLLRDFCRGECILQSFTLPDSP
ncbi:unnamed protein product [Closterium sp. NIES-53]